MWISLKKFLKRRKPYGQVPMEFPTKVQGYHSQVALNLAKLSQWAYPGEKCTNPNYSSFSEFHGDMKNKRKKIKKLGFKKFVYSYSQNLEILVLIFRGRRDTIFSFRGTVVNNFINWNVDLRIWFKTLGKTIKVHQGFYQALDSIWSGLVSYIDKKRYHRVWLTGHSLGGALALLAGIRMFREFETESKELISGIYTFGAPRIGDKEFQALFDSNLKDRCFTFSNYNDIVSVIPPFIKRIMEYTNVGNLFYFDKSGGLQLLDQLSYFETVKQFLAGYFHEQLIHLSWQKVIQDWHTFKYFLSQAFTKIKSNKKKGDNKSLHWDKFETFITKDLPSIEKKFLKRNRAEGSGEQRTFKMILDLFIDLFIELNPYVVKSHCISVYIKNLENNKNVDPFGSDNESPKK
jgi:triacylglycerol lipase